MIIDEMRKELEARPSHEQLADSQAAVERLRAELEE